MALKLIEGFDFPNRVDTVQFSITSRARGWIAVGTGYTSDDSRYGAAWGDCLQMISGNYVTKIFDTISAGDKVTVGFAYYTGGRDSTPDAIDDCVMQILTPSAGTPMISITLGAYDGSSSYHAEIRRGSYGDTVIATANSAFTWKDWTYFEIEVLIDQTAGTIICHKDGSEILNVSGLDTQFGAGPTGANIAQVRFGPAGYSNNQVDDVYVLDDTGSTNNSFLGVSQVRTLLPNADTAQEDMTPSTGTDNYAVVDDMVDDSDYVTGTVANDKDLYDCESLTLSPGKTIHGVAGLAGFLRVDSGETVTGRVITKSGSTESQGESQTHTTSGNKFASDIVHDVDPDTSSAWTKAGVDAIQAGAEVITPDASGIEFTNVAVSVLSQEDPTVNVTVSFNTEGLTTAEQMFTITADSFIQFETKAIALTEQNFNIVEAPTIVFNTASITTTTNAFDPNARPYGIWGFFGI